jgi:hypothetical protein
LVRVAAYDPEFEAGRVAGHRARRLIGGENPAFSDPFLLMAEDWVPRDAFSQHPHRGIETVTLVLDGALGRLAVGPVTTGLGRKVTARRAPRANSILKCLVEIISGANQSQVRERLGEVTHMLASWSRLFGVQTDVIRIT